MKSGALRTAVFYHYVRFRVWMEESPRKETWPWYGVLPVWLYTAVMFV